MLHIEPNMEEWMRTATEAQLARAVRASLTYTIRRLENEAAKRLSGDLKTVIAVARSRLRSTRNSQGKKNQAKLSGSLYSIPAVLLGKTRKSGQGIFAGERYFQGGFKGTSIYSKKLPKRIFHRRGKSRLPIEEDRIGITAEMDKSIKIVAAIAFDIFQKRFEHELKFRVKNGVRT